MGRQGGRALTGRRGAHMYALSGSGDCLAVGTFLTGTSCSTAPVCESIDQVLRRTHAFVCSRMQYQHTQTVEGVPDHY